MKTIIDRARLARRARLSHAASLGGLLAILASVGLSMWQPRLATAWTVLLVAGFAVSTVGIYHANRWVKRPRPEDTLDQALKSLSDQHRLYHYALPCDHVLLTPSGVLAIETCNLDGAFTYRAGRWRQRMTLGRTLRFFVEESLGDPIARARGEAQALERLLVGKLPDGVQVPVQPMVVFVNPGASLEADSPPIPACRPERLRKLLPQNLPKLESQVYERVRAALDAAAGTRPTPDRS